MSERETTVDTLHDRIIVQTGRIKTLFAKNTEEAAKQIALLHHMLLDERDAIFLRRDKVGSHARLRKLLAELVDSVAAYRSCGTATNALRLAANLDAAIDAAKKELQI